MKKIEGKGDFPSHPGCLGNLNIPSEKEREVLSEMRRIKIRVRFLKEKLRDLHEKDATLETGKVKEELARLKKEWDTWEDRRKAAARERMMLLGHE